MDYVFGSCRLLTLRRELIRDGEPVHVEPQVFDLLLFLIQNRGRVVSKDDMLAAVWKGRIVSESTLTNRINSARAAVGDSGAQQSVIRTIARKGLMFVAEVREEGTGSPAVAAPAVAAAAERPAIAVLPFDNFSADPDQEYFADGMTEDLITALAAWRSFPVIARNSTFTFKGRPKNMTEVGAELGARYLVEGSIRRAGNAVRINAQLIDSSAGHHLWAKRFDGDMSDVFEMQDQIIREIVSNIEPQLFQAESRRILRKHPEQMGAWELCLKALWHLRRASTSDYHEARSLLDRARSLEPQSSLVHSLLALWHFEVALLGWTASPTTAFVETHQTAQEALELDTNDWMAHSLLGIAVLWMHRDYDLSIAQERRALDLNPSAVLGYNFLGCAYMYGGQPAEAIDCFERALRHDPRHQSASMTLGDFALPHILLGQYDTAVSLCERGIAKDPNNVRTLQKAVIAYVVQGDSAKARATYRRLMQLQPDFSLSYVEATYPFRNPLDAEMWVESFRKAGHPE